MPEKKILIVYGTWFGSTREVAERIGEIFRELGAVVDVLDGRKVKSAAAYDAVVAGTPVRAGMLPGSIRGALRRIANEVKGKPMAGFVVCLSMTDETVADRESTSRAYLTKFTDKLPQIHLIEVMPFAGAILYENGRGFMAVMAKKIAESQNPDQRDWDAIEAWARSIYPKLTA